MYAVCRCRDVRGRSVSRCTRYVGVAAYVVGAGRDVHIYITRICPKQETCDYCSMNVANLHMLHRWCVYMHIILHYALSAVFKTEQTFTV